MAVKIKVKEEMEETDRKEEFGKRVAPQRGYCRLGSWATDSWPKIRNRVGGRSHRGRASGWLTL